MIRSSIDSTRTLYDMNYITNKKGMVLLSLNHDLAPLHIAYNHVQWNLYHFAVFHQSHPLVAGRLSIRNYKRPL